MSWKIKIDAADRVFSQYIRLLFPSCARCGSSVRFNDVGLPVSHEASHYHGRGHEGTRYDPDNCCTLCAACHRLWEGEERDAYTRFMIRRLGQNQFKILSMLAHTYCQRDRKLALIKARFLLKSLL